MLHQPEHDGVIHWDPPWIRSWRARIKVRINPLSCPTAFSTEPLDCGSYAGGRPLHSLNPEALGHRPSQ
eukprot:1105855-Alexandrium_andersonii.AAC.1